MRQKEKISILEKRFIEPITAGTSFILVLLKYSLGGIAYATASFFTMKFWERWKSGRKN
jgi:hypothetical protein